MTTGFVATRKYWDGGAASFNFRIEQVFGGCRDHNDFLNWRAFYVVEIYY
jgi:hypothetical protein